MEVRNNGFPIGFKIVLYTNKEVLGITALEKRLVESTYLPSVVTYMTENRIFYIFIFQT